MTRIKLCGLTRPCDIEVANELHPEYIGFVFAPRSRRYLPPGEAARLRARLRPGIAAVGVFVNEAPEAVAALLDAGTIDIAQLHGGEDEGYIRRLRALTGRPLIKAFSIGSEADIRAARISSADYVLLDSGRGGTGRAFDWRFIQALERPYFLAGGLSPASAREAVRQLCPFAVDVSSGIETGGLKDEYKMRKFVCAVRGKEEII